MSKEEIFNYFYTNNANLSIREIGITMLAGLAIGLVIFAVYWITYRGIAYNAKFNISLVAMLLISVVIMLMISSNIVISLGMVGALSIVRFRTAVKDSRDTVYIFWAIAEGLCVGSRNFKLALTTVLFIAVFLVLCSMLLKSKNKYILVIRNDTELIDFANLTEHLKPFVKDYKLRTSGYNGNKQEFIFEINTYGNLNADLLEALGTVSGIGAVNWISESGDIIG